MPAKTRPYDQRVARTIIARTPEDARRMARDLWGLLATIQAGDMAATAGRHPDTYCLARYEDWTPHGTCSDCNYHRQRLVDKINRLIAKIDPTPEVSYNPAPDGYYGVTFHDGMRCVVDEVHWHRPAPVSCPCQTS